MRILIVLIFFSNSLFAQELTSIRGTIVDKSNDPIAYASIINISSGNHGTTSSEKGLFLLKTRPNHKDIIQITALGFYELKLSMKELTQLAKDDQLILKERPIDLGEVQVIGERFKQEFIGKSTELLKKSQHGYNSYKISEKPGFSSGVFIKPKKKTKGLIDRIHFYLTEEGTPNQAFIVRLFKTKDKLKNNRVYKIDQFDDMSSNILIFSKGTSGWNSLDLYDSDIYIDDQPFFIVFTTLQAVPEASSENGKEDILGSAHLGSFQNLKPEEVFRAIKIDGGLGYSDVKNVRVPIPAVYVEYSTIKK